MPIESAKQLGLIAILVTFAGLLFLIKHWPQGLHKTYSQHAATDKYASWYYFGLFTIILPLLLVFFFYWFIPTFHLSALFGIFIVISSLFQYLCTIVPESGSKKTLYHRLFAFISATSLIVPTFILIFTHSISSLGRVLALVSFIIMTSLVVFMIKVKVTHQQLLLIQTAYYIFFFVPIILATYL